MLVPIHVAHPEPRKIRRALEAVHAGKVIAYPTDTAYALGCDLDDHGATQALYRMKGLDAAHQLALICPDLSDIARYAIVDNQQYRLLRRLLPGPYTFILEASREVPRRLQSKRKTIGIRVPDHPVPIALVRELGRPLLTTTANVPGQEPIVDPREIELRFKGLELVIDGGLGGVEVTTVIDLVEHVVIREGAGPIEDLF